MKKKRKSIKGPSELEQLFMNQVRAAGLPLPGVEVHFAKERVGSATGIRKRLKKYGLKDWRFDFVWRAHRVAVEINGGNYVQGRHSNATALTDEYRKINKAQQLGYKVLLFDGGMVKSGEALRQVKFMLRLSKCTTQ